MATTKTSIALAKEDLAAAKRAAAAAGLSLSAFLTKLVHAQIEREARLAAMDRYLKKYAPGFRLTKRAQAAIDEEQNAPLAPVRPRGKRRAA